MKSLFILLVLVVVSAALFDEDTLFSGESRRELLSIKPPAGNRLTFDGRSVSPRLCAADNNGTCDWLGYLQALGRLTIPAIALAPLAFIAFWVVCFGRCCCNCFGGFERTPGNVCYGQKCCSTECYPHEFTGYNTVSIWVVRVLYVVCFVALVAVMIPGFFGNAKFSNGIVNPGHIFVNFADDIENKALVILANLTRLPYTTSANNSYDIIADSISPIRSAGGDVNKQIAMEEQYRKPIFIVLLILAPLCFGIGILGGILNKWKLIFVCGLFMFWISTFIWLLFGIQYIILIGISDTCNELTIWNTNLIVAKPYIDSQQPVPQPPVTSVFESLATLTSCTANSSFTSIQNTIDDGLRQTNNSVCDALQKGCFNNNDDYQKAAAGCRGNTTRVDQVRNQTVCNYIRSNRCADAVALAFDGTFYTLDFQNDSNSIPVSCSVVLIGDCAKSCTYSDSQNISIEAVYNLNIAAQYIEILQDELKPLLNCLLFQPLLGNVTDSVCNELGSGLDILEQAFLSIAVILIPGTIIMFLSAKRWRSDSFESGSAAGVTDYEMNTKGSDMSRFDLAFQESPYIAPSPQPREDDHPVGYSADVNPAYSPEPEPEPPAYHDSHRGSANPAYSPEGHNETPSFGEYEKRKSVYNPEDSPGPERLTPPQHHEDHI